MYECFLHVLVPYACLVPLDAGGEHWVSWNWTYRQLRAELRMLGTEHKALCITSILPHKLQHQPKEVSKNETSGESDRFFLVEKPLTPWILPIVYSLHTLPLAGAWRCNLFSLPTRKAITARGGKPSGEPVTTIPEREDSHAANGVWRRNCDVFLCVCQGLERASEMRLIT